MIQRFAWAGVLSILLSGGAAADSPDWLLKSAERLFQRVYARPVAACPDGLDRIGNASVAICATYDRGLDRLKKTLKQFDDPPNRAVTEVVPNAFGPPSRHTSRIYSFQRTWRRQGDFHFRDWLEDGELLVIALQESTERLAVMPKDSCLEPEVRARKDLYFDGGESFVAADAIESPLPKGPPKSPSGSRKGGDAVVQFVVDRGGVVRDACVMHSHPGGFGKRALKILDQWVFVPATIDGEPVDSVVSIAFTWRQRAWDYERTSRHVRP